MPIRQEPEEVWNRDRVCSPLHLLGLHSPHVRDDRALVPTSLLPKLEIRGRKVVNLYKTDPMLVSVCSWELGIILHTSARTHALQVFQVKVLQEKHALFWVFCCLCRGEINWIWAMKEYWLLGHHILHFDHLLPLSHSQGRKDKGKEALPTREACPHVVVACFFSSRAFSSGHHGAYSSCLYVKLRVHGSGFIRGGMNSYEKWPLVFPFQVLKYILHEHVCGHVCGHADTNSFLSTVIDLINILESVSCLGLCWVMEYEEERWSCLSQNLYFPMGADVC